MLDLIYVLIVILILVFLYYKLKRDEIRVEKNAHYKKLLPVLKYNYDMMSRYRLFPESDSILDNALSSLKSITVDVIPSNNNFNMEIDMGEDDKVSKYDLLTEKLRIAKVEDVCNPVWMYKLQEKIQSVVGGIQSINEEVLRDEKGVQIRNSAVLLDNSLRPVNKVMLVDAQPYPSYEFEAIQPVRPISSAYTVNTASCGDRVVTEDQHYRCSDEDKRYMRALNGEPGALFDYNFPY